MSVVAIEAKKRETSGSRKARSMRREGIVPGVIYSEGKEAVSLAFDFRELSYFLYHAHGLVDLKIEGEKAVQKCVLKEVHYHPVTESVMHVDFYGVNMSETLQISVPINLVGTPEGLKMGGILEQTLRELRIECLPADIPDGFEVDISGLELGDTMHVSNLSFENITILNDESEAIAQVRLPRIVQEVEELEEGEEGEEGDVDAEAAEGEDGAEE